MKSQVQRALILQKLSIAAGDYLLLCRTRISRSDNKDTISYTGWRQRINLTSAIKLADIYAQLAASGAPKNYGIPWCGFSAGDATWGRCECTICKNGSEYWGRHGNRQHACLHASTGEQTAQALNKQQHGLFTYIFSGSSRNSGQRNLRRTVWYINKKRPAWCTDRKQ